MGMRVEGVEDDWLMSARRFSGRMMLVGLVAFLLMLACFAMGMLFDDATYRGWFDLTKALGVAGLVLFKIGFLLRRYNPRTPAYVQAVDHFAALATALRDELQAAIARNDPAYPNAERALRNVERWINAAKKDLLPEGPRKGLGLEKTELRFGAAEGKLREIEDAYVAIPQS